MRTRYLLFAIRGDGGQCYIAPTQDAEDELKKIFFGSVGEYDQGPQEYKLEHEERWKRYMDGDYWYRVGDYACWQEKGEDYFLEVFEITETPDIVIQSWRS